MTAFSKTANNETVNAAKDLFWRNGFDETSVEELVQATGLNRYALYNAYGGKLELFMAALEAYYTERRNLFFTVLNDPGRGPLDAICEVIEFCVQEMTERGAGCLMCNVALEVGRYDDVVAERVDSYLLEIRNAKEMALTLAAARGGLNPVISPKQGAALLMTFMLGSGAFARNGASYDELLGNFNTLMTLLRNVPTSNLIIEKTKPKTRKRR